MISVKRLIGLAATFLLINPSHAAFEFSGQIRPEWIDQQANPRGPITQAAALQPGIVDLPPSGPILETELRASGHGLNGTLTIQQQHSEGDGAHCSHDPRGRRECDVSARGSG